jgi:hypothetical protein
VSLSLHLVYHEFSLLMCKIMLNVTSVVCFDFWKDGIRGKNAKPLGQKAAQIQRSRVRCVPDTLFKCLLHTPPSQNKCTSRLWTSQNVLILTKYIENNINIYTSKQIYFEYICSLFCSMTMASVMISRGGLQALICEQR